MIRFSSPRQARTFARILGLILLGAPWAARAADVGIKIEPGAAFPLSQPQSQRFGVGFGMPVKLMYGLTPYADLTAGVSFIGLPLSNNSVSASTGTAWGYGGGARLKGPRDAAAFHGMSPWVDADLLYVRTGDLNRFAVALGAGLAFPLEDARNFWLGPYVRYQQIVGAGGSSVDGRDARILLAGLSFEFGSSPMRSAAGESRAAPAASPAVAASEPDRDGDGVPDKDDLCPDVAGPKSNNGCPVYEKVVIKPDKLELKENIQFARNSPRIEPESHPALDEAVKALQDNRGFRVALEGHSSSEGGDEHNQTLSEQRAQAVLDYLVSHGVAKERVSSKGFSSSRPVESNTTASGREANRRVEFIVAFIILNKGSI